MNKRALITGVNGQDGSYLSEFLLSKGYSVIGIARRASTNNLKERLGHISHKLDFKVVEGDITDAASINDLVLQYKPDEIYNLAAQSHVGTSFQQPVSTWNINAIGVQNILDSIRKLAPKTKFYQASTSEMFGSMIDEDGFQRETTELSPNSPYAIAKVTAHHNVRLYREAYDIFACSGILFNHESPRRGEGFVTRKITKYIASLKEHIEFVSGWAADESELVRHVLGYVEPLRLGNLDAKRDWGFAGDYVEAMWKMLQQSEPDDYVIATGETHTVREFLDEAFRLVGISHWENFVVIDSSFIRPHEVPLLKGDASKAKKILKWEPKVYFKELVKMMVEHESI
jgi:GDPmannose 4,6-dehydratase